MNILYIWDADYPWDIRVEKICMTLTHEGHEVHIAARNLKRNQIYEEVGGLHIHRLYTWKNERLNYALSFPAFFSPIWGRFLDHIISRHNINLIIVRDLPMAIAGIRTGRRHGIPVIFDMAEDYVAMIRDIWDARKFQGVNLLVRNPYLAKIVEWYTLKEADHILVVVEEARDLVIKRGASPNATTVVSNTPPLSCFDRSMFEHGLDLKSIQEKFAVIYTGGIQLGRGIQIVIEAIPAIVKEIPDFLFLVVGSGYATDELREFAAQKHVQQYVKWVGWVDHCQLFDYIAVSRIGVIPHFVTDHVNTTIPNKIFDYMGLGLPVIASDSIPMKRILDEEDCGIIFKSGDPDDLTRAIMAIFRSTKDFRSKGIRAVNDKYNWNLDATRLLSVINSFN